MFALEELLKTTSLQARPYQERIVEKAVNGFAIENLKSILIESPTGCHAINQDILMFNGNIKKVQDITINEQLMGPDSNPRTVLNLCRGNGKMYRITPTKGESFVVNEEHILSLYRTNDGTKATGNIEDISVKEYLQQSKWYKHIHKLIRTGINFQKSSEHVIDPYMLGLLLGDGSILNSVNITSGSGNKFIPQEYKVSSRQSRLKILAGLIDTDGYMGNNCVDYISKSEQLAEDITFICRSLGFAAYVHSCQKQCVNNGKWGAYYRVSISGNLSEIPTKLERKKATERTCKKKNHLVTGFTIEYIGEDNFYGFTLDSDGRYLMGDFTITHNSGKTSMGLLICKLLQNSHKLKIGWVAHRRFLLKQAYRENINT